MSKFKQENVILDNKIVESEPNYDSKAYSIAHVNGQWSLITFDFDKSTGKTNTMKIIESNSNRFEVEEQFKIIIAEDLFQ